MKIEFCCHAHRHSEFSPLDGTGSANQYSWQAVQNGQEALNINDHGRLGGALEHVNACRHPEKYEHPFEPGVKRSREERIIPLLGIEAFYRPDRMMECNSTWANHLCLTAGSLRGWRTLMRLSSKSWVKREKGGGFYGKPVIDMEMIEEDHEDLIISTACLASPLAQAIMAGDDRGAKKILKRFQRYSKNGIVWLEIMPHNLPEQREINAALVNLAEETSNPLLATGDVHIPFEDWKLLHQVVRLASFKQSFKHQEAKKDAGEDVYTDEIDTVFLSSGDQMFEQFKKYHPDLPQDIVLEAMANTVEFVKQVKWYTIGKATKTPKVNVNAEVVVRRWIEEGADKKLRNYPSDHWKKWSEDEYQERREYEFDVLQSKNVLPFFYIIGDVIRWAKSTKGLPKLDRNGKVRRSRITGEILYEGIKRPIRVGLGRGSAAGCLVSHDIGITAIDPIPHKLLFERFLNKDRADYPDIDLDFETELPVIKVEERWLDGRDSVKEYCRRIYGHDHVVDIIAYQTFAPRVVIKEVGAVFDLEYPYLNKITESIGDTERGLEKIANGNPDKGIEPNIILSEFRAEYPEIWDVLMKLEDQILRDTRHAGGILITTKPTNHYVPTQTASDGETTVTAFSDRAEHPILSEYGLLKYDYLGVKSLAKQEIACHLIKEHYGEEFEPNDLPALRDPSAVDQKVMDIFVNGITLGIFQFAGSGITQLLRHMRPDNITDISVANAIYRPGANQFAFEYADRKIGKKPVEYLHESLEPVLGETLGVLAFQEQLMEICKQVGQFSGSQADSMRKACSKLYRLPGDKAQEFMQGFYDAWMHGTHLTGLREEDAKNIWEWILPFGNYAFNRSHSSSYGVQAYQDAHIKAYYPLAFYASTLTITKKQKKEEQQEWLRNTLREATIFDVEAVPPDVNRSNEGWSIDGNKLRYGLVSIDGMGSALAQQVMEHAPYESFHDFVDNIPSGFGADKIVSLAKSGALDSLEERQYLLSRTRKWDEGRAQVKVKMSCGHLKTKTVKLDEKTRDVTVEKHGIFSNSTDEYILNRAVDDAIEALECKHHPDATVYEHKRVDDTEEVARYIKDHPDTQPIVISEPTDDELAKMEMAALNVSLSRGRLMMQYREFIDKRIFTEEEIEELPAKPRKKGKEHGNFCACIKCEDAACIVAGEVVSSKIIKTKNDEMMAFLDIAYGTNHYRCTLFPFVYSQVYKLIERPTILLIAGHKDDRNQIIVNDVVDVVDAAREQGFEPNGKKDMPPLQALVIPSGKVISFGRSRRRKKKVA